MLENINPEVDPCDNFYEYACGGWVKKTVIPEDRSSYSSFTVLREQVQVILKGKLIIRLHFNRIVVARRPDTTPSVKIQSRTW